MVYRLILPDWAKAEFPERRKVLEGEFTDDELRIYNEQFYNIYFLPNCPSLYDPSVTVDGSHIDTFRYVFADMDLKDGTYSSKDAFIDTLDAFPLVPSFIVDSGHGIHCYWQVSDLDAMSFLKLQRRIIREFNTDEAVAKIYQLMRVPGYKNTKKQHEMSRCDILAQTANIYTCEELDRVLPPGTLEDDSYCKSHYDKTYRIQDTQIKVKEELPKKFGDLLLNNKEAREIWCGDSEDRSKADYRLGHLMFANGFTKDEGMSVLVNSAKALARAPIHRIGYAQGIIEKIWTFELAPDKSKTKISSTVREILERSGDDLKGTRFPCWKYIDDTHHGFRLGQVIGLVAGSGVGKTAIALNMFLGFVRSNPDYEHFFIPLEQPANEIADRWKTLVGKETALYDKVHVISNYDDTGNFRHLSFDEIRQYLMKFKEETGKQIGCVVIDHIGALKKKGKDGENQDLMTICHEMKAFAIQTNTLLVMQSQSSREKAGIGDLELNKDAAYGTMYFEAYCDYLITLWQPLKRCYSEEGCPTVTAFKFCKIRHKKNKLDVIQEDVRYMMVFDGETERLRGMTEKEEEAFKFWNNKCTNARKVDRKTDIMPYNSRKVEEEGKDGEATAGSDAKGISRAVPVHQR